MANLGVVFLTGLTTGGLSGVGLTLNTATARLAMAFSSVSIVISPLQLIKSKL